MMTFALGINARRTLIRANIVGPPFSATRTSKPIAVCHSGTECSAFSFMM